MALRLQINGYDDHAPYVCHGAYPYDVYVWEVSVSYAFSEVWACVFWVVLEEERDVRDVRVGEFRHYNIDRRQAHCRSPVRHILLKDRRILLPETSNR